MSVYRTFDYKTSSLQNVQFTKRPFSGRYTDENVDLEDTADRQGKRQGGLSVEKVLCRYEYKQR